MAYKSEIDRIIRNYNLDSDTEKKRAYQECIRYAEHHYANTYDINPFLKEAADRLGQQYVIKNSIYGIVKSNGLEKVTLEYSENNGPTLTANKNGLLFLSNLFSALSKCKMEGEHVHLWRDTHPMTGNTFPLTIYFENDSWFSEQEYKQTTESKSEAPEIPLRNIDPSSVKGIVFTTPLPPSISLTDMRFYRVTKLKRYENQRVWSKTIRDSKDRMIIFTFLDDTNTEIEFALDLDDKDILLLK